MYAKSRRAICCSVAVLLGCAKSGDQSVKDSAAGAVTPAASPAATPAKAINLADVAGKWEVITKPESGKDTSVTKYVLTATADTTGWTITFPKRAPVPVHVMVSGDSVIAHAGPYSSVRRAGVQVTTDGVYRLENGKLVGYTTAHYAKGGADSVLRLHMEGTKMP
jgi:hypothetical protein